ncbi:MAG: glutaredoxin family protein [Woeseia sp.]
MSDKQAMLPQVIVYSRAGCHLCEVLIEELMPLLRDRATLEVRDVDSRPDWRDRFGLEVPVVALGDELLCRYTLDRDAVLRALRQADVRRPAIP